MKVDDLIARLPRIMRIAFNTGGVDAILGLSRELGGTALKIPARCADDHPLVKAAGRAAADAICETFHSFYVDIPIGGEALRVLAVKAMEAEKKPPSLNEIAKRLVITRRHAIRLKKKVAAVTGIRFRTPRRTRRTDPRQIDIEEILGR